jgi:hypothetical protein
MVKLIIEDKVVYDSEKSPTSPDTLLADAAKGRAATAAAGTTLATVPQFRRFASGAPLAPAVGYQGCVVLVADADNGLGHRLQVALYVDNTMGSMDTATGTITAGSAGAGVTWTSNALTVTVMDVPAGFSIDNGDAITVLYNQSPIGKPGPVGSVGGHP